MGRAGPRGAVRRIAGLVPDPYFSASELRRLLDSAPPERRSALAFGTVDSFLLRRLTGGRGRATDATNASRTALFDIRRLARSDELLDLFGVPRAALPEVRDTAGRFGDTERDLPGRAVPVTALAGQGRLAAGAMKCACGTGAFAMAHTGTEAPVSRNRLSTTPACKLADGAAWALEGAIFNAGAAVRADPRSRVLTVPAFAGLGAPRTRAALDSVCFRTADPIAAMRAAAPHSSSFG